MARKWIPILALLLVAILPTRAWTSPRHGDIHLESGEVLTGVDFEIRDNLKIVTVKTPEGDRNFSFTEIAAVFEDGKDRTAELLGITSDVAPQAEEQPEQQPAVSAPPAAEAGETPTAPEPQQPQEPRWISKNSPEYKRAHSAIFKGLLAVSGLYSVPAGSYFDGIKGGIGFDATGVLPLNHYIALRFSAARLGHQWDDKYIVVPLDPTVTILSQSHEFSSWRFSGALEYYKHFDKNRRKASMIYGYSGLGVWTGSMTSNLVVSESGGPSMPLNASDRQTKFMFNLGGGMLGMLNDTVGVNACVEADLLVVGSNHDNDAYHPYGSVQYATNFDFELGLVVLFH